MIYAAADRKNRLALPNTRFLLHQPLGGVHGRADEIEIEAEQILGIRSRLQRIFSEATGQPVERLARDMERNYWMSATAAKDYGLVGRIVSKVREA